MELLLHGDHALAARCLLAGDDEVQRREGSRCAFRPLFFFLVSSPSRPFFSMGMGHLKADLGKERSLVGIELGRCGAGEYRQDFWFGWGSTEGLARMKVWAWSRFRAFAGWDYYYYYFLNGVWVWLESVGSFAVVDWVLG
eukprot:TRINITY_DN30771_c0_g2_i1.p1 TRINITY_DN30771_c0_g2~~TRINITY_DN30771_c0_g2_i1.p1  ORF type:complete len:140 (-),score=21.41 TRINITY_DN30771_c0_g2_i1:531-950(-)